MEIKLAMEIDIDGWMDLVKKVKDDFPGLETPEDFSEHKNTVLSFMSRNSAICAKSCGKLVGALLFSKKDHMLCFLAVDPEYRRQHIAEKMVAYMLTFMDPQSDVSVTTYREGVPEGIAARAFYKRLGFLEGKLTEEFGSPVQEFILKRSFRSREDGGNIECMERNQLASAEDRSMDEREATIRLWFDMWLAQRDLGMDAVFAEDAVYIESWGPEYHNRKNIKHWFEEWNTRGRVLRWDIRQFFHKDDQTVAEWYFKNEMNNGEIDEFDGISLVVWTADHKIKSLKEFGCNRNRYNPYENGEKPEFREEKINWF